MTQLKTWAFSTLVKYEQCALSVKLDKIDRMPKPKLPPDNPLERGNREHGLYESYIKGEVLDLSGSTAKALAPFLPLFDHAADLYAADLATTEQDWYFDENWQEVAPDAQTNKYTPPVGTWLWLKLDLSVTDEVGRHVIIVDFKTGKSGHKLVEHLQQLQLYVAVCALKFPWAEIFTAELWYVDEGQIRSMTVDTTRALGYIRGYTMRATKMMTDRFWRPNPNKHTCRFCPYSPRGTGACPVGV